MMKQFWLYIAFAVCCAWKVHAQTLPFLHPHFGPLTEKAMVAPLISPHSLVAQDSMMNHYYHSHVPRAQNWLVRKLGYEHFFEVRSKNFDLNISPLIILEAGQEKNRDERVYRNTRGIMLQASFDRKWGFFSTFHENQSLLPGHVTQFARFTRVVPGQGYHKPFKDTAFDYAWSEGMVFFKPHSNWQLHFGHGKRFVGHGYRSMLLSDNSFSHLQGFMGYEKNAFSYYSWHVSLMDPGLPMPQIVLNQPWHRKAGVFHLLSFNAAPSLSIGLFEGSVIQSRGQKGKYIYNTAHYNPVILVNSLIGSINSVLGANVSFHNKKWNVYGQYACMPNDFSEAGVQLGAALSSRYAHGDYTLQAEMNHATRNMYAFKDTTLAYTHYNQALAHPLGNGFTEWVGKARIRFGPIEWEYKVNYIVSNSDSTGYLPGYNLFYTTGNQMLLEENTKRWIHEIKLSFIVNPQYNLRLTLGAFIRDFYYLDTENQIQLIYVALQTPIFNRYYDF
jgi:hypothetical protein